MTSTPKLGMTGLDTGFLQVQELMVLPISLSQLSLTFRVSLLEMDSIHHAPRRIPVYTYIHEAKERNPKKHSPSNYHTAEQAAASSGLDYEA